MASRGRKGNVVGYMVKTNGHDGVQNCLMRSSI